MKKNILLALLLCIPILVFYLGYLLNTGGDLTPTGFIQDDNVGYSAYARQYVDDTGFHLFYSNPFNDSPHYPRIYFQTQTFLLSLLMRAGIAPGAALCFFSLVFCLFAILIAIRLYDLVNPGIHYRKLALWLMIWGGGLLALTSIAISPFIDADLTIYERFTYLDPAAGWWGLNFGRPLIFGVESYYHFLFLAALVLLIKKSWGAVALVAFVLSFSHPFTGIHLYLFLLLWIITEKVFVRNKNIPWWFLACILLLTAAHLYYYLFYLPSFPDHKSVQEQYSANWNYRFYHFVPAYILVFGLFALSVYLQSIKAFLANPVNRLFLCLALVSFLLSNHEWFIKPMQPIHFARGYEWISYFFMGLPALHFIFNRLQKRSFVLYLFVGIMLLDNFLWIFNHATYRSTDATIKHLSGEQQNVINMLNRNSDQETLVIGADPVLPYLATVYTKAYAWISHPYTTSYYEKKRKAYLDFLQTGEVQEGWIKRKIVFLVNKKNRLEAERMAQLPFPHSVLLETPNYKLITATISESR